MVELIKKYKSILSYGFISVFVTVIDVLVTWFLNKFVVLVVANTVGVISGGIIQFILNSKWVFHVEKNKKNFLIYAVTFVFGILLANLIIHYSYIAIIEIVKKELFSFLIAKGLSIVIPFFVLYFTRKNLYRKFN